MTVDREMNMRRRNWLLVVCVGIAGCAGMPKGHKDLLDFIVDRVTRREDVLAKLGTPSARFEDSRILAYRLARGEGGYLLAASSGTRAETDGNRMLVRP